jgi:hypothetical protein
MFHLPTGAVTMRRLFSTTTRALSHDNPLVSKSYQNLALRAFVYALPDIDILDTAIEYILHC